MAEKIEICFLGTGSSIPTDSRNHTGIFLKYKDEGILFDCGEGIQRQFRRAKINPCKVSKILLTHWHGDHMLGLPGLMQTLIMNGYSKELEFYGPKGTSKKMQEMLSFFGINPESLKLKVYEVEDKTFFETTEFYLETYLMDHTARTNGYSFVIKEKNRIDKKKLEKLKIPNSPLLSDLAKGKKVKIDGKVVDGKRLIYKEGQRKVSFIVDSRKCTNAVKLSKDSDLLICEASFSFEESEIARDHGHMTSSDAAEIAKKSKSKKLALIHLSQRYDKIPKVILGEAKKTFKNCFVPSDLDKINL